jgi:hypothetical protein
MDYWGSIPGRDREFLSSPPFQDCLLVRGVKLFTCLYVVTMKNAWSHISSPPRVFIVWYLVKQGDYFNVYLTIANYIFSSVQTLQ